MPDVRIEAERVLADLDALRNIGAYKTGVHRPTLSREHVQSLHWLAAKLPEAGLAASIDGIGNVIGSSRVGGAKLLAGSHLESQNHAGWLDGPLGVVYALEAARVINGSPNFPDKAVEVASWCDEEGHYGSLLGSHSYVGQLSDAEIDGLTDMTTGRRLRDGLAEADLAGKPRLSVEDGRHLGYIEAHIEQGDWLDNGQLKIGIVTSIVAIWQYRITIEGVQNHAGTTRMAIRKDAGLAAARLCVAIDEAFPQAAGPRSVWTAGRVVIEPGMPSIIPSRAEIIFQLRDDDPIVLERMEAKLQALVVEANRQGPCRVTLDPMRKGTPSHMSEPFQRALETAANRHAPGLALRMPSGAIHDAQALSTRMPAAMMFVPSIGGISHHWTENTSDADIVLGAQVFATWAGELLTGSYGAMQAREVGPDEAVR